MTLKFQRLIVFGILVITAGVITPGAGQDAAQYRENLETIRREMDSLQKQIAALEKREKTETKSLENLNQQIVLRNKLVKQYAAAESRLSRSLQSTERDIAQKSKKLDLTRAGLSKQLVHLYLHGRTPYLASLLDAESLGQAAVRTRYLTAFLDYEHQQIRTAQTLITDLRNKRAEVAAGYRENRRLRQAKEKEKDALNKKKSQVEDSRKETTQTIEQLTVKYKERQASADQIAELIARRKKETSTATGSSATNRVAIRQDELRPPVPFASLKGKLPYPVSGQIVEGYGLNYNEQLRTKLTNPGVTMSAGPGSAVHAIGYGRVSEVTYMRFYGPMLIIQHDDEYFSVYSPLEDIVVDIGQVIRAGQMLGTLGVNDLGENNRMSLMVYRNGKHVDPTAWISTKVIANR